MILLAVIVAFCFFLCGLTFGLSLTMASPAEKDIERGCAALFGFCGVGLIIVAAFGWVSV